MRREANLFRILHEGILVLEPDREMAERMGTFPSARSYVATVRREAGERYDELDRRRLDALIPPVGLRDVGAFDVCRRVRRRFGLAIVMLAKGGGELDPIVGLELGADDCLSKPMTLGELLSRRGAVTRRQRRPFDIPDQTLRFGRSRIDR